MDPEVFETLRELQHDLAAQRREIAALRQEERRGALLRGLLTQWPDQEEAARRAVKLAIHAGAAGDYPTAAGVYRAMGLPESTVWAQLQPVIEANADFADEIFADLYEPDGLDDD